VAARAACGFLDGFASGGHDGPGTGNGFRDLPIDNTLRWAEKYAAIVVDDYVRRSGPLLGPLQAPLPRPRASYPVAFPRACYRADAGFMVHVQPGCRCSR